MGEPPWAGTLKGFFTTNGHSYCFLNGGSDALRAGFLCVEICEMGWTLSSGWADEKRSCKRACVVVLSQTIDASAATHPKNLFGFSTAAIGRSSRIYLVFISGSILSILTRPWRHNHCYILLRHH